MILRVDENLIICEQKIIKLANTFGEVNSNKNVGSYVMNRFA